MSSPPAASATCSARATCRRPPACSGYRYTVEAEVIGGKKLGRTLGFPTANMQLPPEARASAGIYAVRFRRADGTLHDGVASFGRRPTVTATARRCSKPSLFDFAGDLYGETCSVSFFGHLRDELKFDGLDAAGRADEARRRGGAGAAGRRAAAASSEDGRPEFAF